MTGSELRAMRAQRGESQEAFALHFDVSQETISRWEATEPPNRGPAARWFLQQVAALSKAKKRKAA